MKRTNYYMPEVYKRGLKKLAKDAGGTPTDHVREAVRLHLKRHKIEVPS